MANEEQVKILKRGEEEWNQWFRSNLGVKIDLSGANLTRLYAPGAQLPRANLAGANLSKATLRGAYLLHAVLDDINLSAATLEEADLKKASLMRANLNKSHFGSANLSETDLTGADLTEAILISTNLTGANLREARVNTAVMGLTVFGKNNLNEIIGLEDVRHMNLSFVSTETLRSCKGKIPLTFLRGCGLSDWEIETVKLYQPGLDSEQVTDITYKIHQLYLGSGIQYYSCFISYSSKDQEFAQQLHNDLQNNGVRCWFAPEDMKIGDQIRPTIDQQIRRRDKLLVILSENSVMSEWVGDEVEGALEEESKSNRLVLFPIRLDDAVMNTRDDWAAKIKRRRHIGDFSNWKDKASYQKAFERLLRDLKATGGDVI